MTWRVTKLDWGCDWRGDPRKPAANHKRPAGPDSGYEVGKGTMIDVEGTGRPDTIVYTMKLEKRGTVDVKFEVGFRPIPDLLLRESTSTMKITYKDFSSGVRCVGEHFNTDVDAWENREDFDAVVLAVINHLEDHKPPLMWRNDLWEN